MSGQGASGAVKVGDRLPTLALPPVDRATLALFAGASGDHNPVHIDIDFARRAGLPDVFAHGMLGMAWLGRVVTSWRPQAQLRGLDARFVAIVRVGDRLSCGGEVVALEESAGTCLARLGLHCTDDSQQVKATGEAVVALR